MHEDLKVGKIVLIAVVIAIILNGSNNDTGVIKVIKTKFDLSEAEILMKKTWAPVQAMKNGNLEIKSDIQISSKEEFFETYDFSYMGERMKSRIFNRIVEILEDKSNCMYYIPTIHDKGVFIKKAYMRDSRYKEECAYLNVVELIIEEKIGGIGSNLYRTNIFRKNEEGQWILHGIKGVILIGE